MEENNFHQNRKFLRKYKSTKHLKKKASGMFPPKLKPVKSITRISRKYIPIDAKEARLATEQLLISDKLNEFGSIRRQYTREILGTEEDFVNGTF